MEKLKENLKYIKHKTIRDWYLSRNDGRGKMEDDE